MTDSDEFGGMSGKECHGDPYSDCSECSDRSCIRNQENESFDDLVVEEV